MVSLPPINTAMPMEVALIVNVLPTRIAVQWVKEQFALVVNVTRRDVKMIRIAQEAINLPPINTAELMERVLLPNAIQMRIAPAVKERFALIINAMIDVKAMRIVR